MFFINIISIVLDILLFAMLIRAILSFLPIDDEGGFGGFLAMITEPIILPVRRLCDALNIGRGLPIDIPFFLTSLILAILSSIL